MPLEIKRLHLASLQGADGRRWSTARSPRRWPSWT
jgi:hypothetical protein